MDRISSSTQNATTFSYESLPNEIHQMILAQIPGVNRLTGEPTLRSVSCVNQQLHALALPFLMECYVSMVENALPAFSSEKKADTLTGLNNWLSLHADQMPTNAYLDALMRTKKLTNGLDLDTLALLMFNDTLSLSLSSAMSSNAPLSVNGMIAMQMSLSTVHNGYEKLAARIRGDTDKLQKLWQES